MRVSLRTILSRSRGLLLHRPRGERDRHEHNYLLGPVVPRTRGTASNSVGYKHPMVQRFTKISVQLGPTWGPDLPPRPGCVSQRFLSWRSGVLEAQPGYWLAEKEKSPRHPPSNSWHKSSSTTSGQHRKKNTGSPNLSPLSSLEPTSPPPLSGSRAGIGRLPAGSLAGRRPFLVLRLPGRRPRPPRGQP
jgi:hypothetical protein